MAGRRSPVGNLPAELTSFVGRAESLAQARRLLGGSRLVTLTGMGGVGKSRLALQVARQLSRAFPDGVWLVELAPLQDPVLLAQTVGQALGLADRASGDPVEALCAALEQRRLLVLVDNCERLVPACQLLLTALLRAAPGLRVLATSREVLRIAGERVCEVEPLALPPPGQSLDCTEAVRFPCVALFAQRAGEVLPGFAVTADNVDAVVAVCGLSEGLPLFLELAAAQLRSLSVQQLAGRLDDRFGLLIRRGSALVPRHQTLWAAVEWSFTLCSEAERLGWLRCSVFVGRFDLEAAEAVCAGDGVAVDEVLDVLAALIDKSVLVAGERDGVGRYWMLETLRAYGLERLRNPHAGDLNVVDEAELRRRHRDYYQGLVERFNADWFGPRQVEWSRRMRAELSELRAALAFCLATSGEAPAALRLAGALNFFWYGCGASREGRLWLERALAAERSPTKDRARALVAYVRVLISSGLHAECVQPARECLELARQFDDPALLAYALSGRGMNLMYTGDLAAALPLLDESVERAAAVPDSPFALAITTLGRALAAVAVGDPARADELLAQCRAVCRAHGDRWRLNHALSVSTLAALMLGDVEGATAYGRESLSGNVALGDTMGLTVTLELLGWTAAADGDHQRAARLLGAADQQARANGGNAFHAGEFAAAHNQRVTAARAVLGDARFDDEFARGAEFTLDEAIAYVEGVGPPPRPQPARAAPSPGAEPSQLTKRELEIAQLVAEGLTSKQIAHRLVIAQRTAESHVGHILVKLGFTSRTQIASWIATRKDADSAPDGPGDGRRRPHR